MSSAPAGGRRGASRWWAISLSVAFVVALACTPEKKTETPSAEPGVAGVAAAAAIATPASLTILAGDVWTRLGDAGYVGAVDGDELVEGDTVRTGADSYAVLGFANGASIELEPGTELTIEALHFEPNGDFVLLLRQEEGESWHVVEGTLTASARYEVATDDLTLAVSGGSFRVATAKGSSAGQTANVPATVATALRAGSPSIASLPSGQRATAVATANGSVGAGLARARLATKPAAPVPAPTTPAASRPARTAAQRGSTAPKPSSGLPARAAASVQIGTGEVTYVSQPALGSSVAPSGRAGLAAPWPAPPLPGAPFKYPDPPATVVITLDGTPGTAAAVDGKGRTVGVNGGKTVSYIPGATVTVTGGRLVLTIPNVEPGRISTVVKEARINAAAIAADKNINTFNIQTEVIAAGVGRVANMIESRPVGADGTVKGGLAITSLGIVALPQSDAQAFYGAKLATLPNLPQGAQLTVTNVPTGPTLVTPDMSRTSSATLPVGMTAGDVTRIAAAMSTGGFVAFQAPIVPLTRDIQGGVPPQTPADAAAMLARFTAFTQAPPNGSFGPPPSGPIGSLGAGIVGGPPPAAPSGPVPAASGPVGFDAIQRFLPSGAFPPGFAGLNGPGFNPFTSVALGGPSVPSAAPVPTASPTAAQTPAPTPVRTESPTEAPPAATAAPKPEPTVAPTPAPTPTPTPAPTAAAGYPGGIAGGCSGMSIMTCYRGKVTDSVTGAGIAGVCVYAGPPAGCPAPNLNTDAQGNWSMDFPSGTTWQFNFEHPLYVAQLQKTGTTINIAMKKK